MNGATTLVAILAVNEREAEAQTIAAQARAEYDDPTFHAELEQALAGVMPEPWP